MRAVGAVITNERDRRGMLGKEEGTRGVDLVRRPRVELLFLHSLPRLRPSRCSLSSERVPPISPSAYFCSLPVFSSCLTRNRPSSSPSSPSHLQILLQLFLFLLWLFLLLKLFLFRLRLRLRLSFFLRIRPLSHQNQNQTSSSSLSLPLAFGEWKSSSSTAQEAKFDAC